MKNDFGEWKRLLAVAAKRKDVGGCLLILDGDCKATRVAGTFCAAEAATMLSRHARDVGGGQKFSAAAVFACMEFESWLIAGVESLAGKLFPDGRAGVKPGAIAPAGDLEVAPRDAKKWLRHAMETGYSTVRDQESLTSMVDLEMIRKRPMRSFIRQDHAVSEIIEAIRSGKHVVSPEGE